MPHQSKQPSAPLYLYTVRLWQEETQPGVWEWRGKVQQVQTGETRYFRTRRQLLTLLQELLPPLANNGANSGHPSSGLPRDSNPDEPNKP